MQTLTLEASERALLGTSNSRRLRRTGLVPAVLYGKKQPNVNFAVSRDALENVLRHHGRILDVKLAGGKTEKAILKEVQWDTFGEHVLHIDLGRVALDDKIHLKVPLKFAGDPKGLAAGGHLEIHLHEAHIECLAGDIPEFIKVDVSGLELDQQLRAKDVPMPKGMRLLEHEDVAVAGVKAVREEVLVAAAPVEGAAAAEPEVIAKGKKEEEGEAPAGGEAAKAKGEKK
jgi:large subunit ribosomal protein L25